MIDGVVGHGEAVVLAYEHSSELLVLIPSFSSRPHRLALFQRFLMRDVQFSKLPNLHVGRQDPEPRVSLESVNDQRAVRT